MMARGSRSVAGMMTLRWPRWGQAPSACGLAWRLLEVRSPWTQRRQDPAWRSICPLRREVPEMAIRLVLADDHPVVLHGLQRLFERHPDFEVVGTCANG